MIEMLEMPHNYNFWYYKMGERKTVKAVLVKKSINLVKEKTGFKDSFIHLLLSRLTHREKLVLLTTSLALYDEIKDRDLLILAILEQKNYMFK